MDPVLDPPSPAQVLAATDHLAQARRLTEAGAEWPAPADPGALSVIGVVGAGTMGADIATCALAAGLRVHLLDARADALERARGRMADQLQRLARRAALDVTDALDRLNPTQDWGAFAEADAVVEAVYENMAVKQEVMARLDAACSPGTLLVSNTSTLDIDRLAAATQHPARVAGMHFLTPAHVTPLLEVVRGSATGASGLARARALAQRLGKLPVLTSNAWGFIGNRMFEAYLREVDALQLQGVPAARIDAALEGFGFTLGPCRTLDMAGTDLVSQVLEERGKLFPQPPGYRRITRRLAELGRFGRKSGRGHYLYTSTGRSIDPDLARVCAEEGARLGIVWQPVVSDEEIVRRCMLPLIDEGRQVLQEGVACRASDIDLVWVMGYGFPATRGGPMRMALAS